MRTSAQWILVIGCLLAMRVGAWAGPADGGLTLVSAAEPARVFSGPAQSFPVAWQNTGKVAVTVELRMRLLQTSSATAIAIGEWPWKKLQVLPGQTVLEQASIDVPPVKAETRFLIQWVSGTNRVSGSTEVLVYPTNLLAELTRLAGEDSSLGVFDPGNVLKPLLKAVGVPFEDLEDSGVASFRGRLAILGPFLSGAQMPGDLAQRVLKLAPGSTGVVWFQPPPGPRDGLKPSFYSIPSGTNAVVVVQGRLAGGLSAQDPAAQLRLIQLCRLALHPEPAALPSSENRL